MRIIIGLIAFALPIVVWLISLASAEELTSISGAYHTNGRDVFVGTLFVVGAYFVIYNGYNLLQATVSKIAGVAAIMTALFPTAPDGDSINAIAFTHYAAAGTLFIILSIFCLFFFRDRANRKIIVAGPESSGHESGRRNVYIVCGVIILLCILVIVITGFVLESKFIGGINAFYWAEAIALGSFGFAWFVAGKILVLFGYKEDIALE